MRACLGVLLLALVLRLLHAWQMASSPLYDEPAVDGMTYVAHAEALAAGDWLGRDRPAFWQPPLYPYVLGLVKLAFPDSFYHAVRWMQALWGALACALTCLLGTRLFSPRVGLAAGLAAALCGPLIYFDGEILPASLATVLGLSGLLLLLGALRRGTPASFIPAGLAYGLAALAVPTVLGFCLLAAAWIAWKGPSRLGAALFLLGIAAAVLPVTLRNHAIGGEPVLISYNSGVNFHIGNSADHERLVRVRPGWEWDDLVAEPVEAGIELRSERSAWFWRQALEYMREEPLDYLALQARKGLRLLNGHEEGRNQGIYYWRHHSGVLAATLWKRVIAFPFGLVAPLAVLGLVLAIHRRGLDPATLFVLAYAAGVVAFFPTSRYRAPMLPVLLVLAAHGGWWLWDRLREGRYRPARHPAAAAVAASGWSATSAPVPWTWPATPPSTTTSARPTPARAGPPRPGRPSPGPWSWTPPTGRPGTTSARSRPSRGMPPEPPSSSSASPGPAPTAPSPGSTSPTPAGPSGGSTRPSPPTSGPSPPAATCRPSTPD